MDYRPTDSFSMSYASRKVICPGEYGCARNLHGDGYHRRRHLHRHIHRRVALPILTFCHVQLPPPANSELGNYFCEASLSVLVIGCSLADTSRQSRFLPSLDANPLRCVDSCTCPPPAVSLVQGHSLRAQFNV